MPTPASTKLIALVDLDGGSPSPHGCWGRPPRLQKPVERLQSALSGASITTLDFSEAIERFDAPDTLFIADPPWEGCEQEFEYTLGARHSELKERLCSINGSFVLMCASNRAALKTWAEAPFLYWALVGLCKELVVSNVELKDPALEVIDPSRYGVAA